MSKHEFISRSEVQKLNEKHGWFQFGDAQSDVSNDFANEAIARYEQIRKCAPELLMALNDLLALGVKQGFRDFDEWDEVEFARLVVLKATGG